MRVPISTRFLPATRRAISECTACGERIGDVSKGEGTSCMQSSTPDTASAAAVRWRLGPKWAAIAETKPPTKLVELSSRAAEAVGSGIALIDAAAWGIEVATCGC